MTDDHLLPLLDELARRHGDRAKVTVVVRAGRLPGGAAVYTDDDLREAVAAIGRKAGMEFGDGDQGRERERRREELWPVAPRSESGQPWSAGRSHRKGRHWSRTARADLYASSRDMAPLRTAGAASGVTARTVRA